MKNHKKKRLAITLLLLLPLGLLHARIGMEMWQAPEEIVSFEIQREFNESFGFQAQFRELESSEPDTTCPTDLVLAGPFTGIHLLDASNTITSTHAIHSGAEVTYSAGNRISLLPGFKVSGSEFHGILDGCTSLKQANSITDGFEVTNYPNPYRHRTWISYKLPQASPVRLEVYNNVGQRVSLLVDEPKQDAGTHSVIFVGDDLPAGQYYVRLTAGRHSSTLNLSQLR